MPVKHSLSSSNSSNRHLSMHRPANESPRDVLRHLDGFTNTLSTPAHENDRSYTFFVLFSSFFSFSPSLLFTSEEVIKLFVIDRTRRWSTLSVYSASQSTRRTRSRARDDDDDFDRLLQTGFPRSSSSLLRRRRKKNILILFRVFFCSFFQGKFSIFLLFAISLSFQKVRRVNNKAFIIYNPIPSLLTHTDHTKRYDNKNVDNNHQQIAALLRFFARIIRSFFYVSFMSLISF